MGSWHGPAPWTVEKCREREHLQKSDTGGLTGVHTACTVMDMKNVTSGHERRYTIRGQDDLPDVVWTSEVGHIGQRVSVDLALDGNEWASDVAPADVAATIGLHGRSFRLRRQIAKALGSAG